MNSRFDIPEENAPIEMPDSLEDKCALAHKLLVKQFVEQGMPEEVARQAGAVIVQQHIDDENRMKKIVQQQFDMLSEIHNN